MVSNEHRGLQMENDDSMSNKQKRSNQDSANSSNICGTDLKPNSTGVVSKKKKDNSSIGDEQGPSPAKRSRLKSSSTKNNDSSSHHRLALDHLWSSDLNVPEQVHHENHDFIMPDSLQNDLLLDTFDLNDENELSILDNFNNDCSSLVEGRTSLKKNGGSLQEDVHHDTVASQYFSKSPSTSATICSISNSNRSCSSQQRPTSNRTTTNSRTVSRACIPHATSRLTEKSSSSIELLPARTSASPRVSTSSASLNLSSSCRRNTINDSVSSIDALLDKNAMLHRNLSSTLRSNKSTYQDSSRTRTIRTSRTPMPLVSLRPSLTDSQGIAATHRAIANNQTRTNSAKNNATSIHSQRRLDRLDQLPEYRALKRDLKGAQRRCSNWADDYRRLQERYDEMRAVSFQRPSTDGLKFMEELLENLRSAHAATDTETSESELAKKLGMSAEELSLLVHDEPSKRALNVFNTLYPSRASRIALLGIRQFANSTGDLLQNILTFARRAPGGGAFTMRRLRDVLGLAIRQANYKERQSINTTFFNDGDEFFTSSEDDNDWEETDDDDNEQSNNRNARKSNTSIGGGHHQSSKMTDKHKNGQKQRHRDDDDEHF